jgi:outer membrane protein TolC
MATYQQTVLQSFTQVADVLNSMQHSAELVSEEDRAVDAAQQSSALMRKTFSYGSVTLLQLLDAQRQIEQARLGYVRARAQRYRDTIQLFTAMGSGWRKDNREIASRAP